MKQAWKRKKIQKLFMLISTRDHRLQAFKGNLIRHTVMLVSWDLHSDQTNLFDMPIEETIQNRMFSNTKLRYINGWLFSVPLSLQGSRLTFVEV
jgi:hypothetical protein